MEDLPILLKMGPLLRILWHWELPGEGTTPYLSNDQSLFFFFIIIYNRHDRMMVTLMFEITQKETHGSLIKQGTKTDFFFFKFDYF